jgi:cytochrome c-type biogenesis protein CcmE
VKARQQRMLAVGLAVAGLAIATALTLQSFKDNLMFFVSVTEVVAGEFPQERNFRVGGLVVDGSIQRDDGSLQVRFSITDLRCEMPVTYTGVLPDLFRENQGVVAHGRMDGAGVFVADEILAKHDENYMAPEVAESLAQHVGDKTADLVANGSECETP